MYLESIRLLPDNRIYFRYRPNHYRDWRMVFNMKYQRQEQKFTFSVILVSIICLGFPRKIYYGHLWDYEKQTFRPFILPWPLIVLSCRETPGAASRFTITPQRHYPLQQPGVSSVGILPPVKWDGFRKKNILSPRNSPAALSPVTVKIARPDHSSPRSLCELCITVFQSRSSAWVRSL